MGFPVWSIRRRPPRRTRVACALGLLLAFSPNSCGPTAPTPSSGLVVAPLRPVLAQGDSLRLTATNAGRGVNSAIHWVSLNSGVASVNSIGTVHALAVGVALIVATMG